MALSAGHLAKAPDTWPTPEQEAGTRLEYDALGRLKSQVTAARARGTTVVVKDLFKPLAVRHKARFDPPSCQRC